MAGDVLGDFPVAGSDRQKLLVGKVFAVFVDHGDVVCVGDRAADSALYRIALVRIATDPATKAYVAKHTSEGKSKKEILRCLKRSLTREVFHVLTNPQPVIHGKELREFRLKIGLSLSTAARLRDCDLNRLSRLERGIAKDQKRALEYQKWLTDFKQPQPLEKVA